MVAVKGDPQPVVLWLLDRTALGEEPAGHRGYSHPPTTTSTGVAVTPCATVAVIAVACGSLYRAFKHNGWL